MDDRSQRYARQERLAEIGAAGQRALGAADVAILGLGALGCRSAELLARAGVGRLRLIDRDIVDWPNLQRQALYSEADAEQSRLKAEAAAERLAQLNSEIELQPHAEELHAANIDSLLGGSSLIIDGTDNFRSRYLLNDWCVANRRPWVYAGVVSTYGLVGAHRPDGPCLRCTWPEPAPAASSPTCRSAGVLGAAVDVVASLAVTEAIKILVGAEDRLIPGYLNLDVWSSEFRAMQSDRDPDCPCCGPNSHFDWLQGQRGARRAEPVCGGNAVQIPATGSAPDFAALQRKLDGTVTELQAGARLLRFRADGLQIFLFADGRAMVRGTEDTARARAVLEATVGA
jgi:adenylyltransferase/sulfurtransferase